MVIDSVKNGIKVDGITMPVEKSSKKSSKSQNTVQPKTPVKMAVETTVESKLMTEIEEFENMGYISGEEGYNMGATGAIQPPAPIITEAASEEELEPVPLVSQERQAQWVLHQSLLLLSTHQLQRMIVLDDEGTFAVWLPACRVPFESNFLLFFF